MSLEQLQVIFYIVAIISGLIGVVAWMLNKLSIYEEKKHRRTVYSYNDKVHYYSKRQSDPKLTFSEREYAAKQLKKLS